MPKIPFKIFYFLLGILIFSTCSTPESDVPIKTPLCHAWHFKKHSDTLWLPASVPGTVHTDLYAQSLIPHPFEGDNEKELQWISQEHWDYYTTFLLEDETLWRKQHFLHLEGIDTYAQVFFNDSLVLQTNNAFRRWKVDVSSLIKSENTLMIRFEPTHLYEAAAAEKLAYTLPEGLRIFTRKAQFQYGWDWGPAYNTVGIWREVFLESHNGMSLNDVYFKQEFLSEEVARLSAEVEWLSAEDAHYSIDILVDNQEVASESFSRKGKNTSTQIPFEIQHPKLWWTHNLGEPYLYTLTVLLKKDGVLIDSLSRKKGLRTLELITDIDANGESFYFQLNGQPVFMKGANYIPQNSFQNWVSEAHYENLLQYAVDANMNMLRVWGGGIYENDIFYELCDQKGILVWQDFMFACAMYPGDTNFLENVQHEAIDNVKRLRNYSCIALWCGNNESSEGWHRWGWQDRRSEVEKDEIWNNYLKIFDSILPQTVHQLTDTDYWESSPKWGRGDARYTSEGDAHDWWVWHDGYPFENFEKTPPRFMSEFGFQAFPHYKTIRFINGNDSLDITSTGFKNHQKHRVGFQTIQKYLERDFPLPEKPEDYVYVSQLLQAYGIGKGMEAHRRSKPYTMGSLYWQLNDCWPAVSWSAVDYLGYKKALYYQTRHSFDDVLISFEKQGDFTEVYVINDLLEAQEGVFKLQVMDFDGKVLWENQTPITVLENSSAVYARIPGEVYKNLEKSVLAVANFAGKTAFFYFSKPKELLLKKGEISQTIIPVNDGFEIELFTETLQKNVFLYTETAGSFSDNYFDLLPNQPKKVFFKTNHNRQPKFSWKVLNELME